MKLLLDMSSYNFLVFILFSVFINDSSGWNIPGLSVSIQVPMSSNDIIPKSNSTIDEYDDTFIDVVANEVTLNHTTMHTHPTTLSEDPTTLLFVIQLSTSSDNSTTAIPDYEYEEDSTTVGPKNKSSNLGNQLPNAHSIASPLSTAGVEPSDSEWKFQVYHSNIGFNCII